MSVCHLVFGRGGHHCCVGLVGTVIAPLLALVLWASPWTPANTALEATLTALVAVDVAQTINCMHSTAFSCREENPLVGPRPTDFRLVMYGFWAVVGHATIAYFLPRPWREVWQMVIVGIESDVVIQNQMTFGLSLRW